MSSSFREWLEEREKMSVNEDENKNWSILWIFVIVIIILVIIFIIYYVIQTKSESKGLISFKKTPSLDLLRSEQYKHPIDGYNSYDSYDDYESYDSSE